MSQRERRITIPEDTWESLTYYANDEKMKVAESIRGSITPAVIVTEILNTHLRAVGHYPPKKGGE